MLNRAGFITYAVVIGGLLLSLEHEASAQVGSIQGKVVVLAQDDIFDEILRGQSLNRYGGHHDGPEPEPYLLSEKAVVYISSPVQAPLAPPAKNPSLNQKGLMFRPLVLPVMVGTTVNFPNSDLVYHNVFSYSSPKEFDLGKYPNGTVKTVTFDTPGIVNIFCEIHAYMYATVLVLEHPFFALPDDEGNFTIPNVPPGSYQVSFWYGRKVLSTKSVNVRPGAIANVKFSD
ncbi:MAG: carboxypeptidase regulatory-like domain-containing protein [Ignavibacteria bacterium]|nr:carboxypeptidase regulatory-like domain-containing protein [Ignavibacteria bacterium]